MRYIFLVVITTVFISCLYVGGKTVRGNGHLSTQPREAGNFTGINLKGSMDVYLAQSNTTSVKIEGDENLLPYIEITNEGGVLQINTRHGYSFNTTNDMKIYITAPSFTDIKVAGSGNISSQSKISNASKMNVQIGGSGDVVLDIDSPVVDAAVYGSGSITLNGATKDFEGNIRGSGDIKCFNLLSEKSNVDIAGSGNAEVFASQKLTVDIKGSGDVLYKGNPSISQSIHGSGGVNKAG